MPLVEDASILPDVFGPPLGVLPVSPVPVAEGVQEEPDWLDALAAAFRTDNLIGSALSSELGGIVNNPNRGYSAWEEIKGTPYEAYWESFARSNNAAYTAALKRQIDREEDDRRTLAAAGVPGFIASLTAGLLDPTILIPVGGQVKFAGQSAWTIGRSAARVGLATGASVAVQEAGLHYTQELRTAEESAFAVGTGILLGGLLGTAAGALSRPEAAAAERAIENLAQMPEGATPGSVGAAAVSRATLDDLTVSGTLAERVAAATKEINPNLRANFRASPAARQYTQELAENTLYQSMHEQGRSLGASVETLARMTYQSRMAEAVSAQNAIYAEAKKFGANMSRQEFEEAVGRAMRRGDQGDNEFVSRAAQQWREKVFEPWKNEAIEEGLLPADVSVDTAESYFSRLWNKERLIGEAPVFKEKVAAYYEGRLASDYASDSESLAKRLAAFDREIADLRMGPDERVSTLTALERAGDQLDQAFSAEVDLVSRINDLRQVKKRARAAGDPAAARTAQDEIDRLTAQGGERLRTYLKERGDLRSRYRKVDLNYAGLADRRAKIESSLEKLAEANAKGTERLVARGRTLEKEMQRLDPERLQARIAELKDRLFGLIEQSERAAERTGKMLADREGLPAEQQRIYDAALAVEQRRTEALASIGRRLEAAETMDVTARLDEVRASIDDMVQQVSDVGLRRGAKAQRLRERLTRLDPKKVDDRIAAIGEAKAAAQRRFYDRWEVQRLAEGIDSGTPNFSQHARDIADDVFDKLTGSNHGDGSVDPFYMTPLTRGPMKERTFNIPDLLVEEFLEDNVMKVAERYGRTMSADVELTRRFGRADMRDQIGDIRDEYKALIDAATSAEDRRLLAKDRDAAINDLQALRDLVRGTYKAAENSTHYGRTTRALMSFNYLRVMGSVVIANLSEIYRPAMVHGLSRFMGEGLRPLLSNMDAVRMSVKEAKLAGQITETVLQSRLMTMGEIGDPYRSGTAVERWLTNGTRMASKWNGLVYWTDGMKAISSMLSQNRILEAAVGKTDQRLLAYLGIDGDMAQRVARQFADHGETMDGVRVANTEAWTDADAVRAYRAAVSKDVDSIIVMKSVGDTPLFANTPTGRMILQFRNYMFASHSRVLLRGLQEDQAKFVSGLIATTALGMMAATFRSWRGGEQRWEKFKESASNPGYLIGEGLDIGGIFALPLEIGNTTEKLTQAAGFSFNPVKTPMLAAGSVVNPDASMQGDSTRFAARGPWGALLGPTFGLGETTARAAGIAPQYVGGGEATQGQINAAMSLLPFNSYPAMREALQVLSGDSPYLETGE